MTHDPLCPPQAIRSANPCHYCNLIARVREDERAAALRDAIAAVESREDPQHFPWPQVLIATAAITDLQP